jgi:putative DNA primase/helicase
MGELDALNRSEITRVKLFISSMEDRFRASFDRRPKNYPRQVVFIGTTNEDHYLIDPTGNRRFWPVQVTRQIDLAWLQANRDQLFAEALVYVLAGQRFHPTPKEQRELFAPQQQQRTVENAIESAISHYLYPAGITTGARSDGAELPECTLVELLAKIGIGIEKLGPGRFHEKQAAAALRRLGWTEHKSSRPGRPRVYRRPPPGKDLAAIEPAAAPVSEDVEACPV